MAPSSSAAPAPLPEPLSPFDDPALRFVRVKKMGDEPAPERGVVDVAVLDMNCGYPNLGHSSIVEAILTIAFEERAALGRGAPGLRVISYDLRRRGAVPVSAPGRFPLIVGTGGPGAIDPRRNDGTSEGSQGITEDDAWEAPLFRFFDGVLAESRTALLGICHSFGLLCRWSGVADPALRKAKSMGVVRNQLTQSGEKHPWFAGLSRVSKGREICVLDSRLWDLIPRTRRSAEILAFETAPAGGPGEAMTMLEFARDSDGIGPRVWGANFHPEIGDRGLQRERLMRLAARGDVTPDWLSERLRALEVWNESAAAEHGLQWTSSFTYEGPLRRLIARTFRERRRPARV